MKVLAYIFLVYYFAWHALGDTNFTSLCNTELERLFTNNVTLRNDPTYVCDQRYSEDKPPAARITVSLEVCMLENPGWEISSLKKPWQWAGPLVGFLLPSLAFVIIIPRKRIPGVSLKHLDGGFWATVVWMLINFLILVVDMFLIGVPVAFGCAGPFIAGAVHEAFVDQAVLSKVKAEGKKLKGQVTLSEWYAIAITLVGAFDPDIKRVPQALQQSQPLLPYPSRQQPVSETFANMIHDELAETTKAKLFVTRICRQFSSFSQVVGVPLIFYIGASTYSLVDADARRGENDTAHSVAFGLWYLVFVFTALASSVVLGVSFPTVIESVLAHRDITSAEYKLQWLSERRTTLARWADSTGWDGSQILEKKYRTIFHRSSYAVVACILTLLIIGVPCGLAIAVSFYTPAIGLSCRSVTVLSYLACQTVLVFLWFFRSSPHLHQPSKSNDIGRRRRLVPCLVTILDAIICFIAMGIGIIGTVSQLLGVFRNCICKSGLWYGLPTTKDISEATVLVTTDTEDMRESATLWIRLGLSGIVWLAFWCIVMAVHRTRMRQRCLNLLRDFGARCGHDSGI
jgi:hypothetical protein